MGAYKLGDAERMSRQNPGEFEIPDLTERMGAEPGRFAKLAFELDPPVGGAAAESMWVRVQERGGLGRYSGALANTPRLAKLEYGQRVDFEARHIIALKG